MRISRRMGICALQGFEQSLFAKVVCPDPGDVPAWEQPERKNPYMAGDRVTHGGKTWVSAINYNVWEPGVRGWEEV